ncbi:MAG: DUF3592 domain-containing protein [Actinomycetota bacterium]
MPVLRNRLIVTAVLLAIIAVLVTIEVRGVIGDRSQHRGVVTVSGCTFGSSGLHGNTYDCDGVFTADSGSIGHGFGVDFVTFTDDRQLSKGSKVAARVSGPDDTTATLVSESKYRLFLTGGFSLVLLWPLVTMWVLAGRSARRRETAQPHPS